MAESRPGRFAVALWLFVAGMQHVRGLVGLAPAAPTAATQPPSIWAFAPHVFFVFLIYLIVGLIRFRPFPTALSAFVICSWPVLLLVKFFVGGYSSTLIVAAFLVITALSAACAWYLFRRSYRSLWDPRLYQPGQGTAAG